MSQLPQPSRYLEMIEACLGWDYLFMYSISNVATTDNSKIAEHKHVVDACGRGFVGRPYCASFVQNQKIHRTHAYLCRK